MAQTLINQPPYSSSSQFLDSLHQSYLTHIPVLTPPLKLQIPSSSSDYFSLNKAILFSTLSSPPELAQTHLKYLHAIVNDGYSTFIQLGTRLIDEFYPKLVESCKLQLIWIVYLMIDVAGVGFGGLIVSLLRRIEGGGDLRDGNLWLRWELVGVLMGKWDVILEEEPAVLCSAVYVFLRVLGEHCRIGEGRRKGEELMRREIEFCVRVLREQFGLCLGIGRDLVRVLKDLVGIPELRSVWEDLVSNPGKFGIPEFTDVSVLYRKRTSSRYFLLRILPEMEVQLRFLLSHVKLGSQKRHQAWFARKFLYGPEREGIISDIVRFICCAHHPTNEVLQSDVVPRWAVIGWLLKCCQKSYAEANAKLALFYDWLFFNEVTDNIMNIEPAILLMVNSIPRYMDITNNLLEFLVSLVDNYDAERQAIILQGVSSSLRALVNRGVICSLDIIMSCKRITPSLRERVQKLLLTNDARISKDLELLEPVTDSVPSIVSPIRVESQTSVVPRTAAVVNGAVDDSASAASGGLLPVQRKSRAATIESMIDKLGKIMDNSKDKGLLLLEKILMLYASPEGAEEAHAPSPEAVARRLDKELEVTGCILFPPLECPLNNLDTEEGFQSVTISLVRVFILSQNQKIMDMLVHWSRSSRPVGAQLLSYALRLAYEALMAGDKANSQVLEPSLPLLRDHFNAYFAFISRDGDTIDENVSSARMVNKKLIIELVDGAFRSYECMLSHTRDVSSEEPPMSSGKQLCADLLSCSEWKRSRPGLLFHFIFAYLPDLAAGDEHVVRLLVSQLEQMDFVALQIDLSLRRFSIFGESVEIVLHLVRESRRWDPIEQLKLWDLLKSELPLSDFPVEKLLLDVFCSADLEPSASSLSVGGILKLCSSCAPTPELAGAVMLLPNNNFPDFAAAILAKWVVSNYGMLFSSITEFVDKLQKNGSIPEEWIGMINQSAVMYLLDYLRDMDGGRISMLDKLTAKLSAIQSKPGNSASAMDV